MEDWIIVHAHMRYEFPSNADDHGELDLAPPARTTQTNPMNSAVWLALGLGE